MANTDGSESFSKDFIGTATCVYEDTIGDMDYLFVEVIVLFYVVNEYLGNEKHHNMHNAPSWTKRFHA
jgi:hypothetical protein